MYKQNNRFLKILVGLQIDSEILDPNWMFLRILEDVIIIIIIIKAWIPLTLSHHQSLLVITLGYIDNICTELVNVNLC